MITDMWKSVCFVCGNKSHETEQEMYVRTSVDSIRQIEDVFYACPKYKPENREKGEKPCLNHISVAECEKILNQLADIIIEGEENDTVVNLANRVFETKTTRYKVLSHNANGIKISVLNLRTKS